MESKIDRIKATARGRWEEIIFALAPNVAETAVSKLGQHCACPVHGGQDGFRLFKDFPETGGGFCNTCGPMADGVSLVAWATDRSIAESLTAIDEVLNGVSTPVHSNSNPKPKQKSHYSKKKALVKAWKEAGYVGRSLATVVIRDYLLKRGLPSESAETLTDVARLSIDMPYYEGKACKGRYPTILALVQGHNGEGVTIHRTYLKLHAGHPVYGYKKAPVPCPKKLMAVKEGYKLPGSAIRLGGNPGSVLNVAEGIETALAVMAMGNSPCWSLINANNMTAFVPPAGVKKVVIWADKDRSHTVIRSGHKVVLTPGIDAANALADSLARRNIETEIMLPNDAIPEDAKSVDWLDVYVSSKNKQRRLAG